MLVSLLKQTPHKSAVFRNSFVQQPIRTYIKPLLRPVNQHAKQLLKPFAFSHARRAAPIFYQQQHWTSTAPTTESKTEERVIYNNWLDHLPAKIAPYAFLTRIDKPIGTWLLFWPCGKSFLIKRVDKIH